MIVPPIPNMAAGARAGAWFIEGPRDAAFVPEDAMRVARDNGLEVVREYACLDTSEGRRSTRLRVISDLENGVITTLIAADLGVIAQSNPDLQDLANALARSESRLILFDDGLDTDRSGGGAFADIILATTMWRRSILGTPVFSPEQLQAAAPVAIRSPAPFGYWWSDGRLEPHPREAPIRAEIYSLFADLSDARQVAAALNARGQRLRQNKRFEAADVRRIIRDPVTMGVFRGNRKRAYDPALDSKPVVYVPVAPLVSEALWKECNVKLDGAPDPDTPAKD